VTCVTCR